MFESVGVGWQKKKKRWLKVSRKRDVIRLLTVVRQVSLSKPFQHGSGARNGGEHAGYGRTARGIFRPRSRIRCRSHTRAPLAVDVEPGASSPAWSGRRSTTASSALMDENLIPSASTGESRAFYYEMKGNYHRFLAELATGDPKSEVAEVAVGRASGVAGARADDSEGAEDSRVSTGAGR